MKKTSMQDKATLLLLGMLYKERYKKFAISIQIDFEPNSINSIIHSKIKALIEKELGSKEIGKFKIKDRGDVFECSMLPKINFLNVSCHQIFAILNTKYKIKESIDIIKNIATGMSDIFEGSLIANRVGMAVNYQRDWTKKKASQMRMRQFVISSNEVLEDGLSFNVIMHEDVPKSVVALDLFFSERLSNTDIIAKIDILLDSAVNNGSIEKCLEQLTKSQ